MNILLQGHIAVSGENYLKEVADPHWKIQTWTPDTLCETTFANMAAVANVIVGGNIPGNSWPAAPALSLFQIPWTGYNHTGPERMPLNIPVCNCFEHESAIAEYVLLAMLDWEIRLGQMHKSMCENGWAGRVTGLSGDYHGEVSGKTVGFVGYGHIAKAIAKRAAAFDIKLMAVRRNTDHKPEELSWLGKTEQLPELLSKSDFVVIACDLNDSTKDLFNAESLGQMKSTGVLINVSRGGIVDEEALYNALKNNSIGGAVIDTWYNYNAQGKPEVSPYNYPFNDLDNIVMSAHESAWTEQQAKRRWEFIAKNIRRVEMGQEPENKVFVGTAVLPDILPDN